MNHSKQETFVRCAGLAMCALVSTACIPEIVDLGVYEHDFHRPDGGRDAAATDAAVADARPDGQGDAVVPPSPEEPPACLETSCLDSESVFSLPGRQCYQVKAHAAGDADRPYPVPTTIGQYVKFTVRAELPGVHYLRSIAAVADDRLVVHHMRLYEHDGALPEGVSDDPATPRELRLLHSWAPGLADLALDPSIGIELAQGTWFTLEVYYANQNGQAANDASGFELCATEAPPDHLVSFARLGTEHIVGTSASGTCTPQSERPVHLLLARAQMTGNGRNIRLALEREAGGQELVFDRPFDAFYPEYYVDSVRVQPGDALTTTCTYGQPNQLDDETCYLHVLHWPAHSLTSAATPDVCLQ
jgi:hypothetical protein